MNVLRKLLILFGILLFGISNGYAQDEVLGIIVEMTNGEKMEYRLVDKPQLTFDGKTIILTAEGVKIEIMPTDLQKVTMGNVESTTDIFNEASFSQGLAEVSDGFVRLSGFQSGEAVRVYNAAGIMFAEYKTSSDGSLVISISSLPSGISIIKTNKQSIKISKR